MKAIALLPAAVAAVMAFHMSPAASQGAACQKEFEACMTGCASRMIKTTQESCFQTCEVKNNFCSEAIYGKRQMNQPPAAAAAAPKAQANEALAKEAEPAPAAAAEQPAAAPQPAPAPARQRSRTAR